MRYHHIISGQIRALAVLLTSLVFWLPASGQDLSQLKKDQARLARQIDFTNKLLAENSGKKVDAEVELALLNKQIESRKQLVKSLSYEIKSVQAQQAESEKEIAKLRLQKEDLVSNYGTVIRASYRSKLLRKRWLFLLSAHSLPQMYQRWRYLRQLNGGVRKQLTQISETLKLIDDQILALKNIEMEKKQLLLLQQEEKKLIDQNLDIQKKLLQKLMGEEKRLRITLKKHRKSQNALKKAILASITKTTGKRNEMPMTPAMIALSKTFAANKKKLPWPVSKGLITRSFGKQTHPSLRNVTIVNNGVDIHTEPGAMVRAIFDGRIVGQQFIPGHDHMIILSHGNYYSVYSYLSELKVEIGQEVKTGQMLGRTRSKDGIGQLHLEIWQGKELKDPEGWLKMH